MTIVKNDVIVASNGGIIGPIEDTDTWATHFTSRGWTNPDDQIAAGYSTYIAPSQTADGYYEEDWDYGSVLAAGTITANVTWEIITGAPTISVDLSYKTLIGDPWTTVTGVTTLSAANIRYVKARVNFLATVGADIARMTALNVIIARDQLLTEFTRDLGVGSSGTFDLTGLADLTPGTTVMATQTAAAIATKGNARDEIQCDAISIAGYCLDATTIRFHWRATGVVVGTYAFAYLLGG